MSNMETLILNLLNTLNQRVEKLTDKVDSANIKLTELNKTQEVHSRYLSDYNESLREHMRRTELLETRVDSLEDITKAEKVKRNFIRSHWKRIALIAGVISALASAMWSLVQIFGN